MKTNLNQKKIAAILAMSSFALLTGCGKAPGPVANNGQVPGAVATLPSGAFPIATTNQVPFTATNMFMGNRQAGDVRVKAGVIPYQPTYGQVTLGGATVTSPTYGYNTFSRTRVDGTIISISVTLNPSSTIYSNANATGYVQLSPFLQQYLTQVAATTNGYSGMNFPLPSQMGGMPSYPGTASTGTITGLAIDLQQTLYSQDLTLGNIYFYVNGTQHGMALDF